MYVTVSVVKNWRVFLPWTMFDASVDHTFAKLFEEVHQLDSSSAHCSTSQAATESASVKCFFYQQLVTVLLHKKWLLT